LAWLPYEHGEFDRSERILREGLAEVADPAAVAFLESGLGWILGRRGDWQAARTLLARAAAVLEPIAAADLLARAVDRLAVSIRDTGEPEASLPVFERALRLAVESGMAHEEAMVRMYYAGGLLLVGSLDPARAELARALNICALTGDRYIEAVTTWILAEVEDQAGNVPEAIRLREAELAILKSIGNPQNQAMAHAHIAHLSRRLGDGGRSDAAAAEARRIAANAGIARLSEAVDRALAAADWYSASHRMAGWDVAVAAPGTTRERPDPMLAP
jgi:tetratricopeptide (TPR) repeat protein